HPRRVAVNKKTQQHPGMVGRRTRAAILAAHRTKVEPVDHFNHKARQMLLWQSLVHRRRQKITRLPINRAEIAYAQAQGEKRINAAILTRSISPVPSKPNFREASRAKARVCAGLR